MAMTTTTNFQLMMACVDDGKRLEIREDGSHKLKVSLLNDFGGKVIASKTFRNCETQHSDSERWLNDQVGYPNNFAGVLLNRGWEDM